MIVWDESKRRANVAKHGLDFADLDESYFLDAFIRPARKGRFQAIGWCSGQILSVIFSNLGSEALSIISMRPAKKAEKELLHD